MNQHTQIRKTYKLYIDGKFPRTESGRYIKWSRSKASNVVNICRGSRKDFRNAVVSARNAFPSWASRTAFNRSQILYRIGEMLEGRRSQFMEELILQGATETEAEKEINLSVDRLIYYAGWADKFIQIFSHVNPTASSYFNFSYPEPTGVVSVIAPDKPSLLGLVSVIAPIITGGNTAVVLSSESHPLCSISFAEVLHTSDVPPGVMNILTGYRSELIDHFSTHMDVNAVVYGGSDPEEMKRVREHAALNVKRPVIYENINWEEEKNQSPYHILHTVETKTTWHPVGV